MDLFSAIITLPYLVGANGERMPLLTSSNGDGATRSLTFVNLTH